MMRAVKLMVFLALILGLSLGLPIFAQEKKTEKELEVVVEEKPIEQPSPDQVPSKEKKPMLKARAVDWLDELPGVDLYRSSVSGARNSMLKLRGLDESRILVMLDDVALNGSGVYGGYYVDWESLSLEDIERIQIIRGGHSARFGNVLGGVVILQTKKPSGKLWNLARASISSFNTQNYQLAHSWSLGPVYWNLAGSYYQTDGYLRNNDHLRKNYQLDLLFKLNSSTWLGLHGKYTESKTGFIMANDPNSSYYNPSYPESLEDVLAGPYVAFKGGDYYWGERSHWLDKRQFYWLDFEHQFSSLKLKASFSWNWQDRWEYFYAITDQDHLVLERYSQPEKNTWSGWMGVEEHKIGKHSLGYGIQAMHFGYGGIEIKQADYSYFWRPPFDSPDREDAQRLYSGYVEDTWQALDWLKLYMGLRYDDFYGNYDDVSGENLALNAWSPKLGLFFNLWKDGEIEVRVSKAYRFPTCPESYWYFAGYQPADRGSLKPEDAWLYELEVEQKFGDKFTLSIRGYYYQIEDYIRTIFGYKPSRVVYNIDQVNLGGVEVFASALLDNGLAFSASYTYQDSKKDGDILDKSSELTERLVELPRNKALVAIGYYAPSGGYIRAKVKWIDERKQIVGNLAQQGASSLKKLDSVVLVSAEASYPIYKHRSGIEGRIVVGVDNLTDQKYEEIWGYPMPGRTYSVGVEIEF